MGFGGRFLRGVSKPAITSMYKLAMTIKES